MPLMEPGGGGQGGMQIFWWAFTASEKLGCAWERRDQEEPFGGVGFAMAMSNYCRSYGGKQQVELEVVENSGNSSFVL